MSPILSKTFGGLSRTYYLRQFLFGAIFPALVVFMVTSRGGAMPLSMVLIFVANTLLYPYARFVYERVVGFIMGSNVFFVSALPMLFVKLMTMVCCWGFAVFIAPLGLGYLYFHHTRAERQQLPD
ncbi:hypothetical protein [Variovorax saccharolyticus]|uniref:hypothetical protein n=1 Tax=Variovorax saccharolyticus TaxID=3053516 RepID=UPI002575D61B|nr:MULTISPECIES: hypothetical protein [unclassified Variovorax]MDM0016051.1 hypothetical protein [Variovorax sp. J22R187]MDM0025091.1 hypothetical protein [Variovorax sp. J31P216]